MVVDGTPQLLVTLGAFGAGHVNLHVDAPEAGTDTVLESEEAAGVDVAAYLDAEPLDPDS
jgi:hypothetical protein